MTSNMMMKNMMVMITASPRPHHQTFKPESPSLIPLIADYEQATSSPNQQPPTTKPPTNNHRALQNTPIQEINQDCSKLNTVWCAGLLQGSNRPKEIIGFLGLQARTLRGKATNSKKNLSYMITCDSIDKNMYTYMFLLRVDGKHQHKTSMQPVSLKYPPEEDMS